VRAAFIAELVGEEIPYETVSNITANFYLRHFTEAELKELAAFQRTAVYQKQIGLMLTLMNEATGDPADVARAPPRDRSKDEGAPRNCR